MKNILSWRFFKLFEKITPKDSRLEENEAVKHWRFQIFF